MGATVGGGGGGAYDLNDVQGWRLGRLMWEAGGLEGSILKIRFSHHKYKFSKTVSLNRILED